MSWTTLVIRPVNMCDGKCIGCPWSSIFIEKTILPIQLLEKLRSLTKDYPFDEAVIVCPNPLNHPKLVYLLRIIRGMAKKTYLFIPLISIRKIDKPIVENSDEIVLVFNNYIELINEEKYIKALLSQGIENTSLYLAIRNTSSCMENILASIRVCRKYGLRLRIGEYPYININVIDLHEYLVKRGYEVSLPYGYLYGYRASTAFLENYRVTILVKPLIEDCRKLYVDAYGRVYKCPFLEDYIDLSIDSISVEDIRRMLFTRCPIKYKLADYIPMIDISLVTIDGKVIPKDILDLLELINHTKSFRKACELLGYKPSTYLEKIRSIEKILGYNLIVTSRGGCRRGITLLTPEALKLLEKYKQIRENVSKVLYEARYKNFII